MKKRIMIYFGMFAIFAACLFLCPIRTDAKERKVIQDKGTVYEQIMNTYEDIPSEIKDPVEKGKHLICYLVIALGAVVTIAGGIMLGVEIGRASCRERV